MAFVFRRAPSGAGAPWLPARGALALLAFCALFAPAAARAADINNISLLTADAYHPRQEEGRDFAEFSSSLAVSLFGGIYAATGLDLEKDINEKLSSPELGRYYQNAAERRAIAKRVASAVRAKFLQGPLSNEKVNAAIRFAVSDLGSDLLRRVLTKEGVKDPKRRQAWTRKILQPFLGCMREARTYKEGQRCLEAFRPNAVANLGLAMSHELILQEMGEEHAAKAPAEYARCLRAQEPGAAARVQACVAASVRTAAYSYGRNRLGALAVDRVSPEGARRVVERAAPSFQRCLQKAKDRKGFSACGDAFAVEGGAALAHASVLESSEVETAFAKPAGRELVARAGEKAFRGCAARLRRENKRNEEGTLALEDCAGPVRMAAGLVVAESTLEKKIAENAAPGSPLGKETRAALRACWKQDGSEEANTACLNTTIRRVVGELARARIDGELPAALIAKVSARRDEILARADRCLGEHLSANLFTSREGPAAAVEQCGNALAREAALELAGAQLGDTIKGKLASPAAEAALQKRLLEGGFAECLGAKPDGAVVNRCALALRRDAGRDIATELLGKEYDDFIKAGGGPAAYGLSDADREAALKPLLLKHAACLTENVKGTSTEATRALESCFKATIAAFAEHLASLEFTRKVKRYIPEEERRAGHQRAFLADLRHCLGEKADPRHPLKDYVAQVDICRARLTDKYTLRVGTEQLRAAADDNYPKDLPGATAKKEAFVAEVSASFERCLGAVPANEASGRDDCAAKLKLSAVRTLVLEATRAQARELLNAGTITPEALRPLEESFLRCLETTQGPEPCGRRHVREVAKTVAHLKLHHTMADMLGNDYKKYLGDVNALEQDFLACLERLPAGALDSVYVSAVQGCAKHLEARGVSYSQDYLKRQFGAGAPDDARENALRLEAAQLVPCLDALAVQKPFDADFLGKYDPEGTFEIVARMVGDYINYDAEKAGDDYPAVLGQALKDLEAAGAPAARRNLLDALVKRGMVDQLLKSMVRAEVKKSLQSMPAAERLPPAVEAALLDRRLFDELLGPSLMKELRPLLAQQILAPVLIEGKSIKAEGPQRAITALKAKVAEALLGSPRFGDALVKSAVQRSIDGKAEWRVTRWVGSLYYGYKTYDWEKARRTEAGQKAEAMLREGVLRPRFTGQRPSEAEEKARLEKVSELVKEAMLLKDSKLAP